MKLKNSIPNLITSANLACGFFAIISILNGGILTAALLVILGALFDFFDGAAARLLNASSPIGAQLDSLSDLITFGIVPSLIAFHYLDNCEIAEWTKYISVIIAIASAYRLANFNIDTRQTSSFIGMPTPANALFWISIPLMKWQNSNGLESDLSTAIYTFLMYPYTLISFIVITSFLLNANVPLFSLKFKNLKFKDNNYRFSLIAISIILLLILQFAAIPFILLLYFLLSFIKNTRTPNEIHS